jgi:uncharacterized membrane protein (DUF4010 family)
VAPGDALLSWPLPSPRVRSSAPSAEQAHSEHKQEDFGGIRTFPLIALLGALGALLGGRQPTLLLAAFLGAVVVMLVVSRTRLETKDVGVTTEIAAVVTFGLGALAGSVELLPNAPRLLLVVGVSAVTMALLALKHPLHGFIARVSKDDVYATAKFVVLSAVAPPAPAESPRSVHSTF